MNWLAFFQSVLPLLVAALLIGTTARGAVRVCRPDAAADGRAEPWDKKATLEAGLLMMAACAAGAAFFALCAWEMQPDKPLEQALHAVFPTSMDADHYMKLAEFGYGTGQLFENQHLMIVFFPLFPWLVRGLCALTGLGYYTVGLFIQPLLFGLGGAALYRLVQPRFGGAAARWTLVLLCLLPGSFFFAAPMTESLYLALTMAAFVCMDTDRPLCFALAGFCAALTRSTGGLLAGAALVFWLERLLRAHRQSAEKPDAAVRWLAAALGPAAGTGVYLWLNYRCYGDWFAFSAIQKSHWNQGLGWVGSTVRYQLDYMVNWWGSNRNFSVYVSLLTVTLILAKAAVLFCNRRRLPVSWLAYSVAYILVTDGATWLLSCARYTLSLVFFPLELVLCCRKKWQKALLLWVLGVVWLLYLRKYMTYGPIY